MRIAGVRVGAPYVRLLAQLVEDAGYEGTGQALTDALKRQLIEAPLTLDDYQAILAALENHCPSGLAKLRRELLEDDLRRRRASL